MSRSNNFTERELDALLSCLESMKHLLFMPSSPESLPPKDQKKVWEEIARIVNSVGEGTRRNGRMIRMKWVDLKYRTKRKVDKFNEDIANGESSHSKGPRLSEAEERVLQLIEDIKKEAASRSPPRSPEISNLHIKNILDKYSSDREENAGMEEESNDSTNDNVLKYIDYSTEAALYEEKEFSRRNRFVEPKCSNSRERVRRHRIKIREQHDSEIKDVMQTQKDTYESVKMIEMRATEEVDNGKKVIKNQEEIINKLDSIASLMSDFNGHMENLNDNINILIQVMATKNNIHIVQNDEEA